MNQQVVLITGALTGIGRAAAFAFARAGAKLVVSGRSQERGSDLVAELKKLGAEALFAQADVRNEAQVAALVDAAVQHFGRLDVAVNNAGTEGTPGPISAQTAETYAQTFDTNVLGVVLSLKHELRVMQPRKSGSIINISSTYGHGGAAFAALYSASKHAVEGLTRSAALEVAGSGVRVNSVAPGPTDTAMLDRFAGSEENKKGMVGGVPLGRLGGTSEIAEAIVFLASDGASFITGQILTADGGKSAGF